MKTRRLLRWGSVLLLIGAGGVAVQAQYSRTLSQLLDRPSTNSPSELVGGRYTIEAARPLVSTHGTNAPMFGQRPLPSRASMRAYQHGQSVGLTEVGVQSDIGQLMGPSYFDVLSRSMRDRSGEISAISGLSRAMNINLPRPGQPLGGIPALSACAFTPRPETSRFQDLLGLQPLASDDAARMAPSLAERLDHRSSDIAIRAAADGVALFKEGTREASDPDTGAYRKYLDCPSKLGRAVQMLRMANDLDTQVGLPSLLIVHAALGQDRPLAAGAALLEALHRDPNLLTGPGRTLDPYFGDVDSEGQRSAFLAAQMRRYARLGEYNTTTPVAFALQAYCAWRLGDMVSARAALEKLDELTSRADETEAADLHGFASALRATLP